MLRNVDFYVGTGLTAEWIGSLMQTRLRTLNFIRAARSEEDFRERVRSRIARDPNGWPRAKGWPWSYETSADTDRAVRFGADLKVHTHIKGTEYPWPSWRQKGWGSRKEPAPMVLSKRLGGKLWTR
jgi:hypothetical protein